MFRVSLSVDLLIPETRLCNRIMKKKKSFLEAHYTKLLLNYFFWSLCVINKGTFVTQMQMIQLDIKQ
jgi:hypothetical protein